MYERILIPLDGSQEAEAAAHEVVHLSANPEIVHLQLVENGVMQSRQLEGYTVYADQIHDAHKRSGKSVLKPCPWGVVKKAPLTRGVGGFPAREMGSSEGIMLTRPARPPSV